VSDDFLDQLIQAAKQRGSEFSLPRLIVQATISLLEARQQNPEQDLEDLLPNTLRNAMESIRQQERNRYRPWE
jgi:biopolymer transport protein ExbB/TolQ